MKKSDKTIEKKWTMSLTTTNDIPNEPEDYGTVFFNIPFCYRARFAIALHQGREPSITIYDDFWDNNQRRWMQAGKPPTSLGLPTLRNMMELLEEELEK